VVSYVGKVIKSLWIPATYGFNQLILLATNH